LEFVDQEQFFSPIVIFNAFSARTTISAFMAMDVPVLITTWQP